MSALLARPASTDTASTQLVAAWMHDIAMTDTAVGSRPTRPAHEIERTFRLINKRRAQVKRSIRFKR